MIGLFKLKEVEYESVMVMVKIFKDETILNEYLKKYSM
jgi:hypothetical protein